MGKYNCKWCNSRYEEFIINNTGFCSPKCKAEAINSALVKYVHVPKTAEEIKIEEEIRQERIKLEEGIRRKNEEKRKIEEQEQKKIQDEIEQKVVSFLLEKKTNDAIRYYSAKASVDEASAKNIVIEIAKINGLYSLILNQIKQKHILILSICIPIFAFLCYLVTISEDFYESDYGLLPFLVLGVIIIRSVIILFKK